MTGQALGRSGGLGRRKGEPAQRSIYDARRMWNPLRLVCADTLKWDTNGPEVEDFVARFARCASQKTYARAEISRIYARLLHAHRLSGSRIAQKCVA